MWDPRDQNPEATLAVCRTLGVGNDVARSLLKSILVDDCFAPEIWMKTRRVPRRVVETIGPMPLRRLRLNRVLTSQIDGFRKLRFVTHDGLAIETVLIPLQKAGSASVCLSSQVGCAMACSFCATARMPTRRNLAVWEIIDQWQQARALARGDGLRISGAVFMGMGEPFLNYDRVIDAAELLRCPFGGQTSAKAITISTVGLVPEIDRYTREAHRFRLSISLGAPTDEQRARLVPVAAKTPVVELMAAARRHALDRRDRIMISYVCISGENVSVADARALAELIGDTRVRLDLIDVTDHTGRFAPPTSTELREFRDELTARLGQPVVRRYSGGKEISAACGTLAGLE